jgi:hypothetical protein
MGNRYSVLHSLKYFHMNYYCASSDLSILNFDDIPYSILFVLSVTIEILVTIYIMGLVTWQVLIGIYKC